MRRYLYKMKYYRNPTLFRYLQSDHTEIVKYREGLCRILSRYIIAVRIPDTLRRIIIPQTYQKQHPPRC